MRPSEVESILESIVDGRVPVFLWGPPGIGKSSIMRKVADKLQRRLVDVRAVLLDPVDLRGLPSVNGDGTVHWCPPGFLPQDKQSKGILFLDELGQAPPLVQSACLQLVLDRKIGEYCLPADWIVVAASNRAEDRAGTHRIITPLLNRFIHLDVDTDHDDWQAWAAGNNILPEVRAFIGFKPGLLMTFDPSRAEKAFATPRSWEFVSTILRKTPGSMLHAVLTGCVGEGPAAEFNGFLKLYGKLPDPDKMIADPERAEIPKEPALLWAVCMAVADRTANADSKRMTNIVRYARRLPPEYAVVLFRQGAAKNDALANHPDTRAWMRENGDLITGFQAASA